jgi:hypothetical protein
MPRFLSNPNAYHGEKCTSNDMNNPVGVVPKNTAAIKTTLLLQEATNDMPPTLAYSDDFEGSVVLQETTIMMVENGTRIAFTEPLERSHSQSSDQTGKMLFGDFGEALDDAKAGLLTTTGNLNEATGDHDDATAKLVGGATETLENGVNAATISAVKVADAVGDAASAAKKALLFKGAACIADIEGFVAHLKGFVTAPVCFVGNKQGPSCAGDEEGEVASCSKEDPLKDAAHMIKDMVVDSPFITKLFEDIKMQLEEPTLSALNGTSLFSASTASVVDVSTAATDPCESSSSLACPAMTILKQPMQIMQTIKDVTKLDISVCFPADSAKADVEVFFKDVMAELKAKYSAQFDRLKDAGFARIRKSVDSFKAGLVEAQASIETLRDLVLGIPKRVLRALKDADMTPDSIVGGIAKLAKDLVGEITKVLDTAKDNALKRINDTVVAFSDDANAMAGEAAKSVSDDVIMLRVAFKVGLQRAAKAASPCKKIGTALVAVAKGKLLEMKDNAAKAFDATNGLAVAFVDSVKRVGSIVGSLPLSGPLEKLQTLVPAFVKKAKVDLEAMLESIKKAVATASAAYQPISFVGGHLLSKGMMLVEGRIEDILAVVKTDTTLERIFAAMLKMDKLEHYNAMGEDAAAAATEGVKAIVKARQKAADTAKAAASNAANNTVKSAATAEVTAKASDRTFGFTFKTDDLFEETKKEMSTDRHTRPLTKKAVPAKRGVTNTDNTAFVPKDFADTTALVDSSYNIKLESAAQVSVIMCYDI